MAKDDVGPLPAVPKKRRVLETALDLHIAQWLAGELTPSERRRLEAEKARRKALVPDRRIGLLVGREGATPAQLSSLPELLQGATEAHHSGVSHAVHRACKNAAPTVVRHSDLRQVIRVADEVVALTNSMDESASIWEDVRYAKHRRLPVKVLLPDGVVQSGG